MTGAKPLQFPRKSGQSMVEFLIGLVGLLMIIMGLFQMVVIVDEDFDSLIGAREEVARLLVDEATGNAVGASNYPDQGDFYGAFSEFIRYDDYAAYLEPYTDHAGTRRGFESAVEEDPMNAMLGFEDGQSIDVESGLMRRVMGDRITMRNQVWMPSWEPLMETE